MQSEVFKKFPLKLNEFEPVITHTEYDNSNVLFRNSEDEQAFYQNYKNLSVHLLIALLNPITMTNSWRRMIDAIKQMYSLLSCNYLDNAFLYNVILCSMDTQNDWIFSFFWLKLNK